MFRSRPEVLVLRELAKFEEFLSLPRRLLGIEVGNFGLLIELTAGITKFGFQALDVGASHLGLEGSCAPQRRKEGWRPLRIAQVFS